MKITDVENQDDIREFRKTIVSIMPFGKERRDLMKALSKKQLKIISTRSVAKKQE